LKSLNFAWVTMAIHKLSKTKIAFIKSSDYKTVTSKYKARPRPQGPQMTSGRIDLSVSF
jgi:hypothetical protein